MRCTNFVRSYISHAGETYIFTITCYLLGYILCASSANVNVYAGGAVFYALGQTGTQVRRISYARHLHILTYLPTGCKLHDSVFKRRLDDTSHLNFIAQSNHHLGYLYREMERLCDWCKSSRDRFSGLSNNIFFRSPTSPS